MLRNGYQILESVQADPLLGDFLGFFSALFRAFMTRLRESVECEHRIGTEFVDLGHR